MMLLRVQTRPSPFSQLACAVSGLDLESPHEGAAGAWKVEKFPIDIDRHGPPSLEHVLEPSSRSVLNADFSAGWCGPHLLVDRWKFSCLG